MIDRLFKNKLKKFFNKYPNEYRVVFLTDNIYYNVDKDYIYLVGEHNPVDVSIFYKLESIIRSTYFTNELIDNHYDTLNKYTQEQNELEKSIEEYKKLYTPKAVYESHNNCIILEIPADDYYGSVEYYSINGLKVIHKRNNFKNTQVVWDDKYKIAIIGPYGNFCVKMNLDDIYYKTITFTIDFFGIGDGLIRNEENFNKVYLPLLMEYIDKYYPNHSDIDYTVFKNIMVGTK